MKQIRILLVDDQRSVRQGLRMRLGVEPDLAVVGEADDGPRAVEAIRDTEPDVCVIDYEMPGLTGIEVVRELRGAGDETAFVMLSIHDDASLQRAAKAAGIAAFVAKHEPGENLLAAIRRAAEDRAAEDT